MSGPDLLTARVRRAISEIGAGPKLTVAAVANKAYPKRAAPGWPLADYERTARSELERMFGVAR